MSLQGILQQIQGSNQASNPMGDIQNIVNTGMSAANANDAMAQFAANPKMDFAKAAQYVKDNGGDPKAACMKMLSEHSINGIDPNFISNLMKRK